MTDIWLPNLGTAPIHVHQAAQAIREYDAGLGLAQDPRTEAWVVYLEKGPEGEPFPVFELGHQLPAPEEIKRRLFMADTRRRGREIVNDIERKNEARRKQLREAAHEGAGEAAEVIEWALRTKGHTPHKKVFMPGGKSD